MKSSKAAIENFEKHFGPATTKNMMLFFGWEDPFVPTILQVFVLGETIRQSIFRQILRIYGRGRDRNRGNNKIKGEYNEYNS